MIEYEIKKPSTLVEIGRRIRDNVVPLIGMEQQQHSVPPHMRHLPIIPDPGTWRDDKTQKLYWPKIRFSNWIEGIKREFRVGDLVCIATVPVIEGEAPRYYGMVTYINEIHYECPLHPTQMVPECVSVQNRQMPQAPSVVWAPCVLRHLSEKEIEIALQRDKPEFRRPTVQ